MKPERWSAVRRVLEEAREREADDRTHFLDEACTGDAELRAEVERLLDLEADTAPLDAPAADELQAALAGPGIEQEAIAGYRLVRVIASGGMGTVWEAEQESPRRTVALKVVRAGRLSDAARARFDHETEVLARLGHPAIARLFAAGVHTRADGRELPWYTMELVPGARSVHAFAREQRLDLRERLALFADICDAVHHAHLHGVIHRDLKPGNILVDEHGRPRVIDFGVARSLDADVTRHETRAGEIVGTLHAMAPEQLEGHVDARSDVYALGVVLYELLCDRLPLELDSRSFTDVVRIIQHEPPAPPSLHVRDLPPELDWIVGRALEKVPAQRYPSAAELAADARRWLAGEAVLAGAPGPLYHARVFVRRHRVAVVAGAAVLLALVVATIGTTRGMFVAQRAEESARLAAEDAERQRDLALLAQQQAEAAQRLESVARQDAEAARVQEARARQDAERARAQEAAAREDAEGARAEEQRSRLAADEARARAVSEAAKSRAALDLLIDLFQSPDPRVAGYDVRVVDALAQVDGQLAARLVDAPGVEAELRLALGRMHLNLGLLEGAERHLGAALELGADGDLDPESLADALHWRGSVLLEMGRTEQAERDLRLDLERRRARHGDDHPRTAESMTALARVCIAQTDYAEAEQLLAKAIEIDIEQHGPDDPRTLIDISSLGGMYQDQGRLREAEPLLEEAVRRGERSGMSDLILVTALSNLAMNRAARGRLPEALPVARRVLEVREQALPPGHGLTLLSMANLAAVHLGLGQNGPAGELLARATRLRAEHHLPGSFEGIATWATLALVRMRQDDPAGVREALDGMLAEFEASTKDSLRVAGSIEHLAVEVHAWCIASGRRELHGYAEEALLPALEVRRRLLGPDHPESLRLEVRLLSWRGGLGRYDEALEGFGQLAVRAASTNDEHLMGSIAHERACMRMARGEYAEAEALLLPWVEVFALAVDGDEFRDTVATLYERWGKPEQAARWRSGGP